MSEWYEKSFGEDYLRVYNYRDEQGAAHEVHEMISWLKLEGGAKVLDLCCGMGRHSLSLAEKGYEVTGMDLSDVLLDEAKKEEGAERVRWVQGDMRELPFADGEFDAVVNLFTSFGYFEEDAEHVRVLNEIRRVLRPGGRFIIDFMNPPHVKRHLKPYTEREEEGLKIEERRSIEEGFVKKHITIIPENEDGGERREYDERVKLYTLERFTDMLAEAGLELDEVRGSYDEKRYESDSPRMIFVGKRF
ncbi:class I SAM-dependent methyltransferase [Saccharibacillus alkalitolerans]|uniref:Methyltransferase domain-containing protein n=1 Tax=Saccharibacillus alkalitolerans TaxID=2705290 RepID=A0ABX0F7S5_9BACL|nr:class I SAM-dependent methyltransferase [Saccharibacillus alkalitolerans]NGZ77003.1 methyltransferase domain-containing protein [Saccharibacillus alkalitolerans]